MEQAGSAGECGGLVQLNPRVEEARLTHYADESAARALHGRHRDEVQERGCARIALLMDSKNSPALHFYEKTGLTRSSMIPLRLQL
jgi:hypothetical protein